MNFFQNVNSEDEAKRLYRELCLQHHPDVGGETKTMQTINAQYREVLEKLKRKSGMVEDEVVDEMEIEQEIIDQIGKIVAIVGITIEIAGRWIWITGNTFAHRKQLKESGYFFAPKKKCWYWRSKNEKSHNRTPKPLNWIREKYGSVEFQKGEERKTLKR